MSADQLALLMERLAAGDEAAAEQLFLAYEPYLRLVVRRQLSPRLRAKFDSIDVVHSVWADLLQGFRAGQWHFDDPAQLRAFLVRAARNRFVDELRHHQRAIDREIPLDDTVGDGLASPSQSRPSQYAVADELWDRILAECSPSQRQVVELKRQGLSLAEVADQTGLHPSSVRRILYDLARRLGEHDSHASAMLQPEA